MSLKVRLYAYLIALNLGLLGLGGYFWWHGELGVFLVIETLMVVSLLIGIGLVRLALKPVEFIEFSRQLIEQQDFASRLGSFGVKELDALADTSNQMLEQLHRERLALGEQRGFFDRLLEATPTGIVIFDFDENMTTINPAARQMLAVIDDDWQGQPLSSLKTPLAEAIVEQYEQLPKLITLSNDQRLRVQLSQFYDRGFVRHFLMLEELTEEVHNLERQAYEKLIRMTSHEVNNTIGATNSLLDSCLDYGQQLTEDDREDYSHALNVVIERNRNLAQFMKRLAHVVHLPSPECRPVSLTKLIDSARLMFQAELEQRNICWQQQIEDPTLAVNLDVHLFELVLLNVIKNGYEAIESNGTLTVTVKSKDEKICLAVEDSAGTLSETDRAQVFRPFYTTKRNGQGVGLMLTREILNQHGFDYALTGEPGRFTRFSIWMPVFNEVL